MIISLPLYQSFLAIESQFCSWIDTEEQTKEIDCTIEGTDIKIILNRGYYIYPFENSPKLAFIPHTVNIAPNNDKIKYLFKYFLKQCEHDSDRYYFPHDRTNSYGIRLLFFPDIASMKSKLQTEEQSYPSHTSSGWNWKIGKGCFIL